jgi:hypothetical protein
MSVALQTIAQRVANGTIRLTAESGMCEPMKALVGDSLSIGFNLTVT